MSRLKLSTFCLLALLFSNLLMADPVDDVMEQCSAEIDQYCNQVTPGEGRLMACFYAHEDKLSSACVNALYDAAVALEQAVDALVYVATSCEGDIDQFCADIEPGEGRILNCLSSSRDSLSAECTKALADTEE
jgi:hypothetical protein